MEFKSSIDSTPEFTQHPSGPLKRKRPPIIEIPHISQQPTNIVSPGLNFNDNDFVSFVGDGFGVHSVKGKKKFMEDAYKTVSSQNNEPQKSFFGVYDGHGGRSAVDFVSENLHRNILVEMMKSGDSLKTEEILKAAYLKTDQEFLQKGLVSGACCVTALIGVREIVVSNVGDCRAVLCRGGLAAALTKDHTPENEDECRRIENQGGYVEFHRGAWRVHGVLSVSRSIGDSHLKDWVIAEPETAIIPLTPDMEFLILASDGLWSQVGNQEAVDLVLSFMTSKTYKQFSSGHSGRLRVSMSPILKTRESNISKRNQIDSSCETSEYPILDCENHHSPSLKSRRISMDKRTSKENQDPNRTYGSERLSLACRKLVNLAINRGCLDDITVMVIDMSSFQCSSNSSQTLLQKG